MPADQTLDSCLRDLEAGLCEVVAYDEPILQNVLANNATLAARFQVILGTDKLVLAPAYSGEVLSTIKGTVEQAVIESQDRAEVYLQQYFPSSCKCGCLGGRVGDAVVGLHARCSQET